MNTFQLELVSCMAAHGTDLMSSARKGRIPDPLDFYQSVSIQISKHTELTEILCYPGYIDFYPGCWTHAIS